MAETYSNLESHIFGPMKYIEGYGVLEKLGHFGSFLGNRVLLVGSPTSLDQALPAVKKSLEEAGIIWDVYQFDGFPTEQAAQKIADITKAGHFDFLIGIGGGRVMDVTKYGADLSERRLILIPTISATNASLRVNSIVYDDKGRHQGMHKNQLPACFTLADLDILTKQPVRYLASGILDTLVRFIEMRPYLSVYPDDLNTKVSYAVIEEAYHFLISHSKEYLQDLKEQKPTKRLAEAIQCVIGVCSISANYNSTGSKFGGLAHGVYYGFTRSRENHHLLHGEVVGFGILTQLFAEGYELDEIRKEYQHLHLFGFDYDLEDCGILTDQELDEAVDYIYQVRLPGIGFLPGKTKKDIKEAILKANALILEERSLAHEKSV